MIPGIQTLRKSKILITGATGFLGKRVMHRLKQENINFVPASLTLGTDFRDQVQVDALFKKNKPDVVINCAAYVGGIKFGLEHEGEIYYNNILMSTFLIDSSKKYKVRLFINPISNCSYPDIIERDFKENEWWNGPLHYTVFTYGFVRKASFAQAYAYNKQYKMKFVNFLVPNMYGPDDHFDEIRSHALGALIKKIVEAKERKKLQVIIWGTGRPIREWLYIDDFVEAIIRSFSLKPITNPINIGQGVGISIKELSHRIRKIVGYKGELVFDTAYPDGAPYKVMNVEIMKKLFKWTPQTSLEEGIKKTVKWYYKYVLSK